MNLESWLFSESRLANSPSRKHGIDAEKELSYIQQVSNFIQDMGRRLSLPLLCINTAVLFTQRFYVFHSLVKFEKFTLGAAALFLAAKVEEHPRKVEHVVKAARLLMELDVKDSELVDQLLLNENMLLQTLGFNVEVQHPHQHVVRLCDLVKVSKDLSQTSYILSTYCLHLTKMCLIYKPTVIACVCIHTACKLLCWEIPKSREGKHWFQYVDDATTTERLEILSDNFLNLLAKCPTKYKNRTIVAYHQNMLKSLKENHTSLPLINDVVRSTIPCSGDGAPLDANTEGLARSLTDEINNFTAALSMQTSRAIENSPSENYTIDNGQVTNPVLPARTTLSNTSRKFFNTPAVPMKKQVRPDLHFHNKSHNKSALPHTVVHNELKGKGEVIGGLNLSLKPSSQKLESQTCEKLNVAVNKSQVLGQTPILPQNNSDMTQRACGNTSKNETSLIISSSITPNQTFPVSELGVRPSSGVKVKQHSSLPFASRRQSESSCLSDELRANQKQQNLFDHRLDSSLQFSVANLTSEFLDISGDNSHNYLGAHTSNRHRKDVPQKSQGSLKLKISKRENSWVPTPTSSPNPPSTTTVDWSCMNSVKCSIPKSKLVGFGSWLPNPTHTASPAELTETYSKTSNIPPKASLGSPESPQIKRFKTN